jgi:hypothetical protein
LNKRAEYDGNNKRKNKSMDEQAIKDSVKWSITEYSVFISKLVKKGLSLNIAENLGKG